MVEVAEQIKTEQIAAKQLENQVQFLSFVWGDEEYAVDILRVQQIRSWEPVSRIPNVAAYLMKLPFRLTCWHWMLRLKLPERVKPVEVLQWLVFIMTFVKPSGHPAFRLL
jgi:hypothetical protein